jgi:Ca-activated chloride channel homolog
LAVRHAASLALAALAIGASALARADAGSGAPSPWVTREQQAQRLLDTGHAAQAARLFSDPRRRAYAEERAGRYEDAARLLAPFHDADSLYNRGNALAHAGRLLPALAAYEAALAQAPHDQDIRHNRDLVAKVLEAQAQKQAGRGGASQSSSSRQHGNREASNGQSQAASSQSAEAARSGKSPGSQSGQAPSTGSQTPEQEAEEARQDAALAAGLKRPPRRGGQDSSGTGSAGGAPAGEQSGMPRTGRADEGVDLPWPPPKSEQALALEQWLRRIPEDPGGLLRRKFLIEHMERQERTEP